jgi:hypothetical protein
MRAGIGIERSSCCLHEVKGNDFEVTRYITSVTFVLSKTLTLCGAILRDPDAGLPLLDPDVRAVAALRPTIEEASLIVP